MNVPPPSTPLVYLATRMMHPIITLPSIPFAPFQDSLHLDRSSGFNFILLPGCGEPYLRSAESNPFENKKPR